MKTLLSVLTVLAACSPSEPLIVEHGRSAIACYVEVPCPEAAPIPDAPPVPDAPPPDAPPPDAAPSSCMTTGTAYGAMEYDVTPAGVLWLHSTTAYAAWYGNSEGGLLYQSIAGNFKITSTVHARKHSNTSVGPDPYYQYGGLMARNPASNGSGAENYVHVVVGRHESSSSFDIEGKTTAVGHSQHTHTTVSVPDAELRLCRVDGVFRSYRRSGGSWVQVRSDTRTATEMPTTLQVGPIVYNSWWNPDVEAQFDCVLVGAVPTSLTDCTVD